MSMKLKIFSFSDRKLFDQLKLSNINEGAINDAKMISNVIPEITGKNSIFLSFLRIPHEAFIKVHDFENFPILYLPDKWFNTL